ncbi:hypothetical protein ABBQ32_004450 [Trebouxia sp. C0010 RCD-2024]
MASPEAGQPSRLPQPSVLELYAMQQTNQRSGIRLSLNSELTESITLEKFPYHYCAVTGNVNLAAFMYLRQLQYSKGITVANFAADGKQGTTSWSKRVTLSPVDIANLAGHGPAAVVLSLILARVPLLWSRDTHHLFPQHFKQHAKSLLETLLTVPFFTRLPGSARVQMVDILMTMLAEGTVWGSLSPDVWREQWEECIGDDFEQAQQLVRPQPPRVQSVASNPSIAAYQFQIRTRRRDRPTPAGLAIARDMLLGFLLAGLSICCVAHLRRSDKR